jgi:hypothetical protein
MTAIHRDFHDHLISQPNIIAFHLIVKTNERSLGSLDAPFISL